MPSFFLETKKWKFTHLTWCKKLYYHRCSFRIATYNIWWISTLWKMVSSCKTTYVYPSKALSTTCRWHTSSICACAYVCIHSSSICMCEALCITSRYSKCSIICNGTHVCTCMGTSQCMCMCTKLHLSGTIPFRVSETFLLAEFSCTALFL